MKDSYKLERQEPKVVSRVVGCTGRGKPRPYIRLAYERGFDVLLRRMEGSKLFGDGNIEGDGVRLNRAGAARWL